MKASLAQTNFNAGLLSPLLHARPDLEKYQSGLKGCVNMIPLLQGGLMKRPGTKWNCEVKDSSQLGRVVPFEFSTTQAYILLFGEQTLRFIKDYSLVTQTAQNITGITAANPGVVTYSGSDTYANGDRILITGVVGMTQVNNREFTVANVNVGANTFELSGVNTSTYTAYSSGGTVAEIVEVATPYADTDLAQLSWAQSADTLYIFHPSYAPRKLTRTSHTAWTLSTAAFTFGPLAPINTDTTAWVRMSGATRFTEGATCTLHSNASIWTANHVGELFYMEEVFFNQTQTYAVSVSPWEADKTTNSLGAHCSYNGNVYQLVDSGAGAQSGTSPPVHLKGDAYDGMEEGTNDYKGWRYLHSRYCVVEITGYTSATQVTGTIRSYAPHGLQAYSRTVNATANVGGLIRITVATGHGYQTGDYVNISGVTGTTEANGDWRITYVSATQFTLDGSTYANAYVAGGTVYRYSTNAWAHGAFSAARGYPACGTFFQGRLVMASTSSQPDSLWASVVEDYDNFSQREGSQVTDDSSIAVTLSSPKVNKIRSLTGDGGGLLALTAGSEFVIRPAANTKPFAPGNIEAKPNSSHGSSGVTPLSVGEGTLFVDRSSRRLREAIYDASIDRYRAVDLTLLSNTITKGGISQIAYTQAPDSIVWAARADGALPALTYEREQQITGWHPHALGGYSNAAHSVGAIVESVAAIPSPDASRDDLYLIVQRYVGGAVVRYVEYLDRSWDIHEGAVKDAYFVDGGATYSGSAVTSIGGLWHLRSEQVSVLADGVNLGLKTVSALGVLDLGAVPRSVVQIGYAYNGDVEELPLQPSTQEGSAMGGRKTIEKMYIWVYRSGEFQAGASDQSLDTVRIETGETLVSGIKERHWDEGQQDLTTVFVRQPNPLPLVLLATRPRLEASPK